MSGIVENNVVKMEWSKDGWLQTSGKKGKKPVFILASKDYVADNGDTISVIFTATTAFVFADDFDGERDIWSAADLIEVVKSEMPGGFPYGVEQYVPIIESGEESCKMNILETLGLVQYKDDIEARMKDIAPFGYEEDAKY